MDRLWHFLAERGVDLADLIEAAIRTRAERLAEFPMMGREAPRLGIRELSLADIQYRIGHKVREGAFLIVTVGSTREKR